MRMLEERMDKTIDYNYTKGIVTLPCIRDLFRYVNVLYILGFTLTITISEMDWNIVRTKQIQIL